MPEEKETEEKENLTSFCESLEKLVEYLKDKAENHRNYKYYSTKDRIDNIIKNNEVYFSNGKNWNDETDKDMIDNIAKKGKKKLFVLCLSYSQSENVAMWMLYSGNNGCMINYSKEIIGEILNAKKIRLGRFVNNSFEEIKTITSGYKIYISDVLYYGASKERADEAYYIRRSGETVKEASKTVVDELTYQKKTLPWMYENECRIIVEVTDESVINPENAIESVAIKINSGGKIALKDMVFLSPNYKYKDKEYKHEDNEYKPSKLKGKINWDLCSNCKRKT